MHNHQSEMIAVENELSKVKEQFEFTRQEFEEQNKLVMKKNGLIDKVKKRCINVQRDYDVLLRQSKLVEKENYELNEKLHELSE